MSPAVEYDAFAYIYDVWAETAPVTRRNLPFYVAEYLLLAFVGESHRRGYARVRRASDVWAAGR
jgi:hypothetical protein